MKALLKAIGILIVVLVAVAIAVPMFYSVDDLFETINEQVTKTTGRQLNIDGEKTLRVFPSLSVELNQVRFSNMDTGSRPDMMTMDSLVVHIPWMSLLSKELNIEKFVINNPDILLEKDAKGQANWDMIAASESAAVASDEPAASGGMPEDFDITLGEVAIYGGQFTYADHQAGTTQTLSDLALSIALPSLKQPLGIKGEVTYMAQTFEMQTKVTTPSQAMNSEDFAFEIDLESELLNLTYNGNIANNAALITGTLKVNGDSVKNILAWQNQPLVAKESAFNKFDLSADMRFEKNQLSLTALAASLDDLAIKGTSSINLNSPLTVNADIDLGMLNLNPYLPEESTAAAEPKKPTSDKAEPLVWDDTAMDLSGLSALNADINVRSSGLVMKEIKLGQSDIGVKLHNGVADIALRKFVAYQGNGNGKVHVDSTVTPYKINTSFSLTDIDAQPLLTDAAGFNKLIGTGSLGWNLKTAGISQKQFVNALNGTASFKFADGAVKGGNIGKILRSVRSAIKGDFDKVSLDHDFDESEKTDFSALSGSFNFVNGVGTNTDLSLASPLLRLSGNGDVNLPSTKVDYHLKPKLVATSQGQGGKDDAAGFSVPIRIKGPFHDIKIKPDVSDAAKDELKDKVTDKLKGLFG